jgi:hypothetical protein
MPPHVVEGPNRYVGKRESRNSGAVQYGFSFAWLHAAHPAREDGFAVELSERCQLARNFFRIAYGLRRHDDKQAVRVRVSRSNLEAFSYRSGPALPMISVGLL